MLMRMEMEVKEMSLIFGDNIQIMKLKILDAYSICLTNNTQVL